MTIDFDARLFDLLDFCLKNYPKDDALACKVNQHWIKYSTASYKSNSEALALGLIASGLPANARVGLISNNRPEWNFADMGSMMAGAINVPIYPTISDHDLAFIIADASIEVFFVSNKELYEKVRRCSPSGAAQMAIYTFDELPGLKHWKSLLQNTENQATHFEMRKRIEAIEPKHCATILYTSGTTGNPKGVMLSHQNLISQLLAVRRLMPVSNKHRALSFLPINHVYERMLTYNYFHCGTSIYYAESLDTIGANLLEVKPHIFTTVPRLLEKIFDRIMEKGNELKGIKKWLFNWSLNLGFKYGDENQNGLLYKWQLALANALVFNKWRAALGGELITTVSGGAALQERLARIFWAAKIPVLQGYGLTETSPVIAVNYLDPGCNRFGTVGPVIDGVEVQIAADGEILTKGPHIMLGYFNNDAATKEVIEDGWFHTGDIGEFVDGKFLRITDRKKEIFKTSGGKYISPSQIENKLRESPLIEQAMVIGENRKFPAALIVPNFSYFTDWALKNGKKFTDFNTIANAPEVIAAISQVVATANSELAHYEAIKKFELVANEWTIADGELTPKLSLKRKFLMQKYKGLVDKIYDQDVL